MSGEKFNEMFTLMTQASSGGKDFGVFDGNTVNLDYRTNDKLNGMYDTSGLNMNMMTTEYKVCNNCCGYHYSWWPSTWCNHRDKTAEAFKIIQELMKIGVIKEIKSVNKFIEIVGKISEIL